MNPQNSVRLALFFLKVGIISVCILAFSWWKAGFVQSNLVTLPSLQADPIQTETYAKAMDLKKKGKSYQVEPIFDYELWGIVVADHDSNSWTDSHHEEWGDYLNSKDVCVIWGANLTNPYLKELKFSHGDWTCYVKTSSNEAWANFKSNQLSNNHLIPGSDEVQRKIQESSIGDEIHIKGYLVNYSIDNSPARKSSVTREDSENGACEIIYVNEFEILKRHNNFWIKTLNPAKTFLLVSAIGFLFSLFVLPFTSKT